MPTPYTVQPGDSLTRIASQKGFSSWQEIYYHPDNTLFREKRPDPNSIFPGDVLMLPGKTAEIGGPLESNNFVLFLLRDPSDSRLAKAIIGRGEGASRDPVGYKLQPRPFAEAMARKVGARDVRSADFRTPEMMTTRSFAGPTLLVQLINTGAAAMSRLNFTAQRADGSKVPLFVEMKTNAAAGDLTVGPGSLVLDEANQAQNQHAFVLRSTRRA